MRGSDHGLSRRAGRRAVLRGAAECRRRVAAARGRRDERRRVEELARANVALPAAHARAPTPGSRAGGGVRRRLRHAHDAPRRAGGAVRPTADERRRGRADDAAAGAERERRGARAVHLRCAARAGGRRLPRRPRPALTRLVGINHVALEVGDVDEALEFYGRIFEFTLRGRGPGMAFIDMGDQFIALMQGWPGEPDRARHFGLVVDDKDQARRALVEAGVEVTPGRSLDFHDLWGNSVQVVQYDEVQFTKTDAVLRGMGLELGKTDRALAELREKGLAEPG